MILGAASIGAKLKPQHIPHRTKFTETAMARATEIKAELDQELQVRTTYIALITT